MPTSIRLTQSVEARLDNLAQKTERTKAFYLRELVERVQQPLQFPIETVPNKATAKSLLLSDEEKEYKRFDDT